MAKEEILTWANDNHIKLDTGTASGQLIAGVGYVPEPSHPGSQSAVCKGFGISISLELDASDRLVRDEVTLLEPLQVYSLSVFFATGLSLRAGGLCPFSLATMRNAVPTSAA